MGLGIGSNLPGMQANHSLLQNQRAMQTTLARLSTGIRVNQGREGPAALIISELMRSQIGGVERSVRNSQEAFNVLGIAEGGLQEVSNQLTSMRALAVQALNDPSASPGQVSALQSQLNGSINAIGNILSTTRYANQPLLDGAKAIDFTAEDPAGLLAAEGTALTEVGDIAGQRINVHFAGGANAQAERAYVESDLGGGATLDADQEFTVTGNAGSRTFAFDAGTTVQEAADTINRAAGQTGVNAYAVDTGGGAMELRLVSTDYGADQSVHVEQTRGEAFAGEGASVRDAGQNATVTVDGQSLETSGLELDLATEEAAGTLAFQAGDPGATTLAQTGYDQATLTDAADSRSAALTGIRGGMRFQLGEGASTQNRAVFGMPSLDLASLGGTNRDGTRLAMADLRSGGAASLAEDPAAALAVIDQAIADVSTSRAQIGAYQANTLETNMNSLQVALENMTATESGIRDADMAREVGDFVTQQILQKTGLMAVQSSNLQRQNILGLLGG